MAVGFVSYLEVKNLTSLTPCLLSYGNDTVTLKFDCCVLTRWIAIELHIADCEMTSRGVCRAYAHAQKRSTTMEHVWSSMKGAINRRSFLKNGLTAASVTASGAALLSDSNSLFADDDQGDHDHSGRITRGDAAMLRFAAAAEILETDFWVQYNELAGIQDSEEPDGTGNSLFTAALSQLDSDMAQYVHDNTDDEFTHQNFLNAYLMSKGEAPANLDQFRTLGGSTATGSSGKKRLTNLMQLTLDTSWWTRYRSDANNPDLDPNFVFPQAVPSLFTGEHTAIPRTDDDTKDPNFLQAIANTAGFHMPTIEQGGNSLYPAMAQRATSVEVLRILISIGPT